jgi:hypothetical protein
MGLERERKSRFSDREGGEDGDSDSSFDFRSMCPSEESGGFRETFLAQFE